MPDYSPCYCVGSAFILQRPDVFAELSLMSFFFVFEAGFVACVSGFDIYLYLYIYIYIYIPNIYNALIPYWPKALTICYNYLHT